MARFVWEATNRCVGLPSEQKYSALLVLAAALPEAVGVEDVHILKDRGSVMGVPDAVHHTPAFWDLETLWRGGEKGREGQRGSIVLYREREQEDNFRTVEPLRLEKTSKII